MDLSPRPLPLLTATLPGTGGAAKVTPEDFLVEEIPAYLPAGVGDHLYLWVEKRDLTTSEAIRLVAGALGVSERDIGAAGQKDKRAVTRQWLSVLTKANEVTSPDPRLTVIETKRHGNKLRLGHTRGNRFVVTLRGTTADALPKAAAILDRLDREGLPNFYDSQRFGRRGDNAALGAALLGIGEHPEAGRARRDRFLRRLALSALQSEIFNRVLAARLADGSWTTVIAGDILRKRASGGIFFTDDPAVDQPRVDSCELDVTGSLPGHRQRPMARDRALALEEAVLAEAGITREAFARGGDETEGAHRPLRVPVGEPRARAIAADAIEISFALPSGSYATRVLAEVAKTTVELPPEE